MDLTLLEIADLSRDEEGGLPERFINPVPETVPDLQAIAQPFRISRMPDRRDRISLFPDMEEKTEDAPDRHGKGRCVILHTAGGAGKAAIPGRHPADSGLADME